MTAREDFQSQTQGLPFTKDFHSAQRAVMTDDLAPPAERILALVKYRAWGRHSLYAVLDDGTPAQQKDFATELGINKGTVSRAVGYLTARGYIRADGRRIYPEIAPVLTPAPDTLVRDFDLEAFENSLEVDDPATFSRWRAAKTAQETGRAMVREGRAMAKTAVAELEAIRQLRVAAVGNRELTDPQPASLLVLETVETVEKQTDRQTGNGHANGVGLSVPPPESKEPENPLRGNLRRYLVARGPDLGLNTMPSDAVLGEIEAHIPDEEILERFKAQVDRQSATAKPASWRYFVPLARAVHLAARSQREPAANTNGGVCTLCKGVGLVQRVIRGMTATERCECRRKPPESEHDDGNAHPAHASP
jgi:hypothetical protein